MGVGLRPTLVRRDVVALATAMAVLLYLDRVCLSVIERYLAADLALTKGEASWVLSAFFWTYALAQVPAGWLSDRFGARRMLTLYIFAWSLCTGLLGAAHSFAAVLAWRLGCGAAQAGAYPTSANLLSRWVPLARRGWASGVVSTGGRIGGVLAPALTATLMVAFASSTDSGWRPVLFVYGAAGLAVAAAFWLVVRDGPREHPACNDDEIALIEAGRQPSSGLADDLPVEAILRSRGLWLSSISQFMTNFGWVFLLTWLPRYLAEVHEVPPVEIGWMTGLPILVGLAGMLAGGWLTDVLTRRLGVRWGRCLPMALTRFVAALAFATCTIWNAPWPVTAALCLMAVATDLGTPATWAFLQDVGGRHVGAVLGWTNMWGNIGAALSPLVLNRVVELGGWNACFATCAAAFVVAGIVSLGIDATVPVQAEEKDE